MELEPSLWMKLSFVDEVLTYSHELWIVTKRIRLVRAVETSFRRRVAGLNVGDCQAPYPIIVEPLLLQIERNQRVEICLSTLQGAESGTSHRMEIPGQTQYPMERLCLRVGQGICVDSQEGDAVCDQG